MSNLILSVIVVSHDVEDETSDAQLIDTCTFFRNDNSCIVNFDDPPFAVEPLMEGGRRAGLGRTLKNLINYDVAVVFWKQDHVCGRPCKTHNAGM